MLGIRSPAPFILASYLSTMACGIGLASVLDARALQIRRGAQFPGLQGWAELPPPMNLACPPPLIAPTMAECEAMAKMWPAVHVSGEALLSDTWPVSDATMPPGCSWTFGVTFNKVFSFNTHPTGAGHPAMPLVCKTDDWQIYKSKCPDGLVSTTPEDCQDFVDVYNQYYRYDETAFSDANYPPGCVGYGGPDLPKRGTFQYNVLPADSPGSETNPDAFVICVPPPTPAPTTGTPAPTFGITSVTPAPTAGPTPAPTTGITSATGDPHMTTVSGVRFDIMRAGTHALLHIPQGAVLADTLLRVEVAVAHQGSKCEDMYIKVLNVTGSWAEEKHVGGFSFVTESPASGQVIAAPVGSADWSRLGMVDLKVVRGATKSGVLYLNMFARHLRDASRRYPIGGILGLDDHAEAATPAAECGKKLLSLLSSARDAGAPDRRSVADASL